MASTVSPAETTGAFSSNGDTRASTASPVASMPPPPTTPPTSVCSDYAPSSPIMGMKICFLFFYKMLRSLYTLSTAKILSGKNARAWVSMDFT